VTLRLAAQGSEFDKNRLTVPAGSRVTVEFANRDMTSHNFAVYPSAGALASDALVSSGIFRGPDETVVTRFTAPAQPGTYYFRCDVHGNMRGELIVR
jgi:plastocyanin